MQLSYRAFNLLRLERHELMYGLEKTKEAQEVEAHSAVQTARGFLSKIKEIIKS